MQRPADSQPGMLTRGSRGLLWLLFSLGLIAGSLLATWHIWAAADFGYRYWHDIIGIDANIAHFGPKNRYRQGFETTTLDERARLFGGIVDAIHGDTDKLKRLRYHAPDGRVLGRLLRLPEIQHLKDVAWLLGWFQLVATAGGLAALAIAALAIMRSWPLPRLRTFATGATIAAAGVALTLAAFGPIEVFYALHVWLFPPDHQWFFYYRDSLMSTMMRAPMLFGAIAAEWAVSALLLFAVLLAVHRALHRRMTASGIR